MEEKYKKFLDYRCCVLCKKRDKDSNKKCSPTCRWAHSIEERNENQADYDYIYNKIIKVIDDKERRSRSPRRRSRTPRRRSRSPRRRSRSPRRRSRSIRRRSRSPSRYDNPRSTRQESFMANPFIDEQFYPYSQFHNLVSPRYFQAPTNSNQILNSNYPIPSSENYFIDNQGNRS